VTREQRILSVRPEVEAAARYAEYRYRTQRGDLSSLAWIAAIRLLDSKPEIEGSELRRLVRLTIRRRALDYSRTMFSVGEHRNERWFSEQQLPANSRFRDARSESLIRSIEAKVLIQQIRALSKPRKAGPGNRSYQHERLWAILIAYVGYDVDSTILAGAFNLTPHRILQIVKSGLLRLSRLRAI
jgi:hypothetical protein